VCNPQLTRRAWLEMRCSQRPARRSLEGADGGSRTRVMIDSISTLDQAMQRIATGTVLARVARSPSAAYRAGLAELA